MREVVAYRPEIDGLRCLAVLPVIFYHAGFSFFSGGYVGVDIFFVISGYLISTIILREMMVGRFSFVSFYERRARRIFPALFAVMLLCVPAAWLWLTPGQLKEFSQSLVAVSLFLSNIYFWLKSGYFGSNAEELPLLHTWSLSVEEQFYVVFPIVLLGVLRWWPRLLMAILVLGGLLSLAVCLYLEHMNPASNFFLSPNRAWELMAGALLATEHGKKFTFVLTRKRLGNVLSAVGLILVVVAMHALNKNTPYPGRFAVAPVLGTVLLIGFATPDTWVGRALSLRPLVGVGLVSYSLYLWHQPLFAFGRALSSTEPSRAVYWGLIVLTSLVAFLSWRFVERPFRDHRCVSRVGIFSVSLAAFVLLVAIGAAGYIKDGFPQRFDQTRAVLASSSAWSPLRAKCHAEGVNYLRPEVACIYLTHEARWAVLGDSHGVELAYALAEDLKAENSGVLHLTFSGCAPALHFESNVPGCSAWLHEAVAHLEKRGEVKDVVLVYRHSFYLFGEQMKSYPGLPVGRPNFLADQPAEQAREAYWQSFFHLVERLRNAGKTIHVVGPIPDLPRSIDRYIYKSGVENHRLLQAAGTSRTYYEQRNTLALAKLAALTPGPRLDSIDAVTPFCTAVDCAAIIHGKAMYSDDNHLSIEGARHLVRSWRHAGTYTGP